MTDAVWLLLDRALISYARAAGIQMLMKLRGNEPGILASIGQWRHGLRQNRTSKPAQTTQPTSRANAHNH